MNYGLYLSASGALANMYRQDVYSNNLANVNTTGFKSDMAALTQRAPESVEGVYDSNLSQRMLDKLGGGVLAGPQKIMFAQGPIEKTEGPLDVAITQKKQFFVVGAPDGQKGVRLTRDGRFAVDKQGYLVTVTNGQKVLGPQDQPIHLQTDAKALINGKGQIIQNNQVVGQLQVTQVQDTDRLVKQGQNLLTWTSGSDPRSVPAQMAIEPQAVEKSSVDPIRAMMNIMDASRAAEDNAKLISFHDRLMDQAVNTLGRLA